MNFKTFFDKFRTYLTTQANVQPKISIDFDSYDERMREPLTQMWERFQAEFEGSFQDVEIRKYSDQCQKKAVFKFGGVRVNVEGPRYKNPDYKPSKEPRMTPQEEADASINRWMMQGRFLDNASPPKLRSMLTLIQNALGYDPQQKPDVELINAVNRLTLTLHKKDILEAEG